MLRVGKWLVNAAYGLFLALYVYAAAAFGLTRQHHIEIFQSALGLVIFIWLVGHLFQGRRPRVGKWPCLFAAAILGFGWFVTALGYLNDVLDDRELPSWAGNFLIEWSTYDTEASISAMLRTTALLGGMLMAIDFWKEPARARGLVLTMLFSALGMVVFFSLQRIVGAPFVLMSEDGTVPLSFATYRYHGNAASYLNLLWPIAAAVAIFATVRQSIGWPFWFVPLAATLLATFLNVSKAGNVLAPAGIGILLLMVAPDLARELRRSKRKIRKSRLVVAFIPILIIAASVPYALPWKRWDYYAKNSDAPGGRMTAYTEFVKMVPLAGSLGLGPGTFSRYSLPYTRTNPFLKSVWYVSAHEDYLQTVIEWGYVGAFLWGLLLVPPFVLLFRVARGRFKKPSLEFEGYRIGVVDHLKALFDTLPGPREPCLAAGAFAAVTLTAIHSAFDFPMQIASLQFYFLILLALGWSYLAKEEIAAKSD